MMDNDKLKEIAFIAWKGAANAHRMYPNNKHSFAEYWAGAESQFKQFLPKANTTIETEVCEACEKIFPADVMKLANSEDTVLFCPGCFSEGLIAMYSDFATLYPYEFENYQKALEEGLNIEEMQKQVAIQKQPIEKILCAANYYDDGKVRTFKPDNITTGFVICGRRHHNCINIFAEMMGFPYTPEAQKLHNKEIQGFLTSTNRFVDRKEAFQIARIANQIYGPNKGQAENSIGLTSEDLY